MNNQFDELTKGLAQSVTRRQTLKKFGVGLAALALACFGLTNKAEAGNVTTTPCSRDADCSSGQSCCNGVCVAAVPDWCDSTISPCCCYCASTGTKKKDRKYATTGLSPCDPNYYHCIDACGLMALSLGC